MKIKDAKVRKRVLDLVKTLADEEEQKLGTLFLAAVPKTLFEAGRFCLGIL